MLQTLVFIPHWIFEGPLLVAWLVIGAMILAFLVARHGNSNDTWSFLPIYGIVALVIYFVLPRLEVSGINPADPTGDPIKLGLAIRGYGMFLLLALVAGVGLIVARCRFAGLTSDQVLQLSFWMMISGIAGARLFFVIQNRDDFFRNGVSFQTLIEIVDMTKGGLVVYGSLVGGSLGAILFLRRSHLPLLKTADVLAPAMPLGLAIGRIGCLMNGCCFGGVCELPIPSVTFPAGSLPYMQQLYDGDLIGIHAASTPSRGASEDPSYPIRVESIESGSLAEELGLRQGDEIAILRRNFPDEGLIRFLKTHADHSEGDTEMVGFIESKRLGRLVLPISKLPARSLQTHPTQIYAAINAALLCLVLWFFWTIRKVDGEVFGLMLIFYSISRFLMEIIRTDEAGQFGTSFTISQWVSIATIGVGILFLIWLRRSGERVGHEPALA